ncbi:hypothetical protein [Streptomyces violarus]|uniref:hypothetical protein n=1 Tax=Streptomyces violarus TaxID=67380 RepID=UPI0021C1A979|nr:hypothetical protein [Streptomyces violarus]MCT9139038.1 hypothetical protein [Streptomyces violarus]
MSARDKLLALDGSDEWPAVVDRILAEHRVEVLAEHGRTGEKCIPGGEQPAEDGATHRHPRPCEFPEVLPCLCSQPGRLPDAAFIRARNRARIAGLFRLVQLGRAAAAEQRGAAA